MHWMRPLPWLTLLVVATAGAAPAEPTSSRLYCCTDASGRRICGDLLPQGCYERAYKELSGGGRVVREVEAPLTPEQRAKKDAELRAQRDRIAKEAEARRRDQVLLESYSSVGELDRRRDRDLANVEGEIRSARAREADLVAQSAKLEKQKPAKGPLPKLLADNLAVNASELQAVRSIIAVKQREIGQLRLKFEADRQRYLELTGGAPAP